MAAENIAFLFTPRPRSRDWTSQELAEFYRVESALIQGGMKISTDRGVSDEGDPWFVFCREEGGDPVVHFARIDGQYIIASPAYSGVARGLDFRSMVQDLISRHKLAPVNKEQKSNIFMHPAALLVILVGTAFFKTPGEARADETHKEAAHKSDGSSGVLLDRWGSQGVSTNGAEPATLGDKLELARNMSQLLMVAASAVLTADTDQPSPQTKTTAVVFPSHSWSDDGKTDGYSVASFHQKVHLNSDGIELGASEQGASSSAMELPAPASPHFGTHVSSVLKLMTDLNDILSSHSSNSSALTHTVVTDNALSPAAGGFNNEAGFLAMKSAAALPASMDISTAQITGMTHAGASASETIVSQGASFYENGTVVQQLPADLTNVASLASVATQVGNADNFLAANNIFVDLHQGGSTTPISVQQAAFATQGGTPTMNFGEHPTDESTNTSSTSSPPPSTSVSGGNAGTATVTTGNSTDTITSAVFLKTLEVFLEDTPTLGVTVSHDHFIFYNWALTTAASNESITMAFTDGSSIEIVGQASTLVNIIAHAQA